MKPLQATSELTPAEHRQKFAAAATYQDTGLTNSVYILGCSNFSEAALMAQKYFEQKAATAVLCKVLERITILPQGENIWSKKEPVLTITYQNSCHE